MPHIYNLFSPNLHFWNLTETLLGKMGKVILALMCA